MCDGLSDVGVSDCVSDDECVMLGGMLGWMLCVMFLCNVLCDVAFDGVGV